MKETYYITKPNNTKQITNIAFYDKNGGIKTSIDMVYNPDGSLKPFTVSYKNGVPKPEWTTCIVGRETDKAITVVSLMTRKTLNR